MAKSRIKVFNKVFEKLDDGYYICEVSSASSGNKFVNNVYKKYPKELGSKPFGVYSGMARVVVDGVSIHVGYVKDSDDGRNIITLDFCSETDAKVFSYKE